MATIVAPFLLVATPCAGQSVWSTPRSGQPAPLSSTSSQRFDARSPRHAGGESSQQPTVASTSRLQWRTSDRIATQPFPSANQQAGNRSDNPTAAGSVMRVAYQQAEGSKFDPFADTPQAKPVDPPAAGAKPNPFNNNPSADAAPTPQPGEFKLPGASDGFELPKVDQDDLRLPNDMPSSDAQPTPQDPNQADSNQPSPLAPPSNDERQNLDDLKIDSLESPFKRDQPEDAESPSDRDLPESDMSGNDDLSIPETVPRRGFGFTPPKQRANLSCQDLRDEVASRTITRISLDISPPFRPDVLDDEKFAETRKSFDEEQEPRDWRSIDGSLLGRGTLSDLSYQDVIVRTESGAKRRFDISQLSEADLAFLSTEWGLPRECRIAQAVYQGRHWTPMTYTWKASNLCHNPLYFEEVQLERYGHSAGPFQQPIISTAHFFVNIAVLPYKMGIHPPKECQYALGYYRPGNCAPYLLPPIPLSLRGAVSQAAVVTGGFWLIP